MKIMSVFGTRPEAIKMCPVIKELERHIEIESVVCLTGQHKEMLNQVIELFKDFEIIEFKEVEKDGTTGLGKMKHWHIFDVIAKKI